MPFPRLGRQTIPKQEGARSPGEPLARLSALLLALTSTRNAIRVRVSPADALLSDPDGNPRGRGRGYHLDRNCALKAPQLMQAPESHR